MLTKQQSADGGMTIETVLVRVGGIAVKSSCSRALEATIREYLTISNGSAKPFVWTKTADDILAKVAGFCQRISNSGHYRR